MEFIRATKAKFLSMFYDEEGWDIGTEMSLRVRFYSNSSREGQRRSSHSSRSRNCLSLQSVYYSSRRS